MLGGSGVAQKKEIDEVVTVKGVFNNSVVVTDVVVVLDDECCSY